MEYNHLLRAVVQHEIEKDSVLCFQCLFHCAHAQGDFSKNLKQKRHDARLNLHDFSVRPVLCHF